MAEARSASAKQGGLIAAIALALRLGVALWAARRIPPTADGTYYQQIAERIASGHGYTWLWPDGAVTFAAHYPVGYPALIAPLYALFGAAPVAAMVVNALLGALAAFAVHRMLARYRSAATVAGLLVALHPGLIAYTPALMTEGVTASLLACAGWAAAAARRSHARAALGPLALLGVVLGLAALVRPQSIVLAPLFALAAAPPRARPRFTRAAIVCALALTVCLPWTLRNCARMGRCAFVSVNGGWNLLIGTDPRGHGGWAPLDVPPECRQVFDEAGKDRCFELAARRRIAAEPALWLSLAPGKLRATFDYCGAGGWYLHQANPGAFGDRSKFALGVIETIFERLVLACALLACLPARRARSRPAVWRRALVVAGVIAAFSPWGFAAHLALALALAPASMRSGWRAPWLPALAALGSLVIVHAAFFGGGRYQLPLLPLTCALAALARPRRLIAKAQHSPSRSSANTTSHTGKPTTLEYDPSTRRTNIAPIP